MPDGEQHKTLQTAGWVFDALVGQKMNRDATVLALGGGVVGDIAGFAAACYQRGVGYVQFPTTLLAQVDSSVGGKTGVNHSGGKNLIGAFYQPLCVIADTDTLATLPDRELQRRAGRSDQVRLRLGSAAVRLAGQQHGSILLARDVDALTYAIARSCEIKATVVAKDEREQNLRAILNFGHTFGHAIEAATGYDDLSARRSGGPGDADRREFVASPGADRRRHGGSPARPPVQSRLAHRGAAHRRRPGLGIDANGQEGARRHVRLVLLEKLGRAIVTGDYGQAALDATLAEHFG